MKTLKKIKLNGLRNSTGGCITDGGYTLFRTII